MSRTSPFFPPIGLDGAAGGPVAGLRILGMPPGRATLAAARTAYRARIAEYHPDKTMNLGKQLQELAARKTLALNLLSLRLTPAA